MEGEPRKGQMTSQAWLPLVTAVHTGISGYKTEVVSKHLQEVLLMKSMGEELRKKEGSVTTDPRLKTQVEGQPLDLDHKAGAGAGVPQMPPPSDPALAL